MEVLGCGYAEVYLIISMFSLIVVFIRANIPLIGGGINAEMRQMWQPGINE